MPISELGYRHWEGKRVSQYLRWLAIARSDFGIAYRGSKLLRRFLLLAWAPLLYFCPVFFAIGWVANPENDLSTGSILAEIALESASPRSSSTSCEPSPRRSSCPRFGPRRFTFSSGRRSSWSLVILSIVAPPLISRDVRSKAFLLYFSKPISTWEYLLGKLSVALFFVFLITLLPAMLLYAISIVLSPDLGTLVATAPIIGQIAVTSLFIALPASMLALFLSSLTKDHRIATFAWIAMWIIGFVSHKVITVEVASNFEPPVWALVLSLRETGLTCTTAIFDLSDQLRGLYLHLQASGLDVRSLFDDFLDGTGPPATRRP